jgi:predicted dinucleotide-binding enzyme
MKIAVLGTGTVGRVIAAKLATLGHEVTMGTRDAAASLARTEPGNWGAPSFSAWAAANPSVKVASFADAAAAADVLFNCTSGTGSVKALEAAGAGNMVGKVLIDVANPLDFSKGMPPSLSISNTDSLAEAIQRAFPETKVVKSLNTMTATLMVDPSRLPGDHDVFVAGNDPAARAAVSGWLREWFGWKAPLDLGDLTAARGLEQWLPLWLRLYGAVGKADFNIHVVR